MALIAVLSLLVPAGCDTRRGRQTTARPQVPVVTIAPKQVELSIDLPGRTSAYRISEIRSQVNGIIQKQLFKEGSDVNAGDPLYQIDPVPFQAYLGLAKASLAKAQANLPAIRARADRNKELLVYNGINRKDADNSAAALEQAMADIEYWSAAVETARINLDHTRITAPIFGRIGTSNVIVGALVRADDPQLLTTIQQWDPIYVDVAQSSTGLMGLKRDLQVGSLSAEGINGRQVRILLEDGTLYPLKGELQFRDIAVDQATESCTLRIVVPNPQHLLLPGMSVRASLEEGIVAQAILVPQQAVSRNLKGEPVALIVDETDTVQRRTLELNRTIGDQWLVSSGISPGDRVIVRFTLNVREGTTVKAVPIDLPKEGSGGPYSSTSVGSN